MLKREFNINFKTFIIWLLIILSIFLISFLMYPAIIESNNIEMLNDMLQTFPEELLVAFNFDISNLDNVYGWLKSEGMVYLVLIVSCYAAYIGGTIIVKEENDKTIEYLNSLPVSRNMIYNSKVIIGLINIIMLILIIGIFNYIGLTLSGEFDKKQYLLLSISPLFPALVSFFGCLFISTFTHKTKRISGLSFGIVLISYILYIISTMSEATEFIKYFSLFTLADLRNIIVNNDFSILILLISIVISVTLYFVSLKRYNNKDLV